MQNLRQSRKIVKGIGRFEEEGSFSVLPNVTSPVIIGFARRILLYRIEAKVGAYILSYIASLSIVNFHTRE